MKAVDFAAQIQAIADELELPLDAPRRPRPIEMPQPAIPEPQQMIAAEEIKEDIR